MDGNINYNKSLALIVPCFNEEEIIEDSAEKLLKKINDLINANLISKNSKICFVNDGSRDNTLALLEKLTSENEKFSYINLARNYGHQYAILAGLKTVKADMTITIDADLQDDINIFEQMIEYCYRGYNIVYGCREERYGDSFFKKYTALIYYKIMKFFCPSMKYNCADYRLMDKKAIDKLKAFSEKTIFLRGLIPMIGLNTTCVFYNRLPRTAGITKYTTLKMVDLALRGITNSSTIPLQIIIVLGILLMSISIVTFLVLICYFIKYKYLNTTLLIINIISIFSGLIITTLGLVAEYIALILSEVKNRPSYLIESTKNLE